MKKYKPLLIFLTASAVLLSSWATAQAGRVQSIQPEGGGRLVIWRSPGLGRNVIVGLTVDGRHVADLTYGRHYDEPISPGRHVIGAKAFPAVYQRPPYTIEINVRPGELYNFTAKGGVSQLVLK